MCGSGRRTWASAKTGERWRSNKRIVRNLCSVATGPIDAPSIRRSGGRTLLDEHKFVAP
jgi:hypothetical protein